MEKSTWGWHQLPGLLPFFSEQPIIIHPLFRAPTHQEINQSELANQAIFRNKCNSSTTQPAGTGALALLHWLFGAPSTEIFKEQRLTLLDKDLSKSVRVDLETGRILLNFYAVVRSDTFLKGEAISTVKNLPIKLGVKTIGAGAETDSVVIYKNGVILPHSTWYRLIKQRPSCQIRETTCHSSQTRDVRVGQHPGFQRIVSF